ncbi:hypothetical protein C0995_000966 [Termitomyces sp. Mi166|nr:hypothetical protein C0995_000966 [Termitomyces sp. Mi166\
MHFSTTFLITISLILQAFAGSSLLVNDVKSPSKIKGEYILTFKSKNRPSFITHNNTNVIYHYNIINGVAGRFTAKQINELQASPHVERIYEDHEGIATTNNASSKDTSIQRNATWGLARLSSKTQLTYNNATKKIKLRDVIAGLEWAHKQIKASGRRSVVLLNIIFNRIVPIYDDVLTDDDIPVVVAAGNMANKTSYFSPACVPSAITVAASNISDQQASLSNYGDAVDIFAPGEDIVSTGIASTTATTIYTGTSMVFTTF